MIVSKKANKASVNCGKSRELSRRPWSASQTCSSFSMSEFLNLVETVSSSVTWGQSYFSLKAAMEWDDIESGVALGLWKVLWVFAIYRRVPCGSSQRLGLGSPVCSFGRLGVLERVVNQPKVCQSSRWHTSVFASQHGISRPELTSLMRSTTPSPWEFRGSHNSRRYQWGQTHFHNLELGL